MPKTNELRQAANDKLAAVKELIAQREQKWSAFHDIVIMAPFPTTESAFGPHIQALQDTESWCLTVAGFLSDIASDIQQLQTILQSGEGSGNEENGQT